MRQFGIDADRDLMVDFDHAVLFADIGMCQVLVLKRSSPQPQVTVRRKSKIRHSDKPSVAQFREFAGNLYVKRRMHERMNELIGGLVLDAELTAAEAHDVDDEERRGWELGSGSLASRRLARHRPQRQNQRSIARAGRVGERGRRAIRVRVQELQEARPQQVEPEARWRRIGSVGGSSFIMK